MQRPLVSFLEQIINLGTGFVISVCVMMYVITPLFSLPLNAAQNINITIIFTAISILRGFLFRRLFNWLTIRHMTKAQPQ